MECPSHPTSSPTAAAATRGYAVAGILERYLGPFLADPALSAWCGTHHRRVLRHLIRCRTPDAGNHAWKCQTCGHVSANYNSCGNRHCPACAIPRRLEWLDQVKQWTLPCVYLHIVFTLPHEFHDLIEANRRALYDLLFTSGTRTLLGHLQRVWRITPSIIGALHSWGQAMLPHYHSHNVVSCGGLTDESAPRWLDLDPRDPRLAREVLAPQYRARFLRDLWRRFERGQLTLPASMKAITTRDDFAAWLALIVAKDWMVNVQPPPEGCDGPATALGYLGRYVAGSAIGDQRILHDDGTHVTIRVKDYRHGGAEGQLTISGVEFVRRFCLHILPPHYRRIRYAGLVGQRCREKYLLICRELLRDRLPDATPESVAQDAQPAGGDLSKVSNHSNDPTSTSEETGESVDDLYGDRPLKACPRCHSTDLLFIEIYWPDTATIRAAAMRAQSFVGPRARSFAQPRAP